MKSSSLLAVEMIMPRARSTLDVVLLLAFHTWLVIEVSPLLGARSHLCVFNGRPVLTGSQLNHHPAGSMKAVALLVALAVFGPLSVSADNSRVKFECGIGVHPVSRRWYHRHEFAMMLDSVGFREVAVQCGYTDSDRANPEAEWTFIAKR